MLPATFHFQLTLYFIETQPLWLKLIKYYKDLIFTAAHITPTNVPWQQNAFLPVVLQFKVTLYTDCSLNCLHWHWSASICEKSVECFLCCFISFFCPPLLRFQLTYIATGLGDFILTPEQQSQAGRLSTVYFVSMCPLRLEGQNANTHTDRHKSRRSCSLNHHPTLFKMNGWYLAFHYSHLCLWHSFSQQCDA